MVIFQIHLSRVVLCDASHMQQTRKINRCLQLQTCSIQSGFHYIPRMCDVPVHCTLIGRSRRIDQSSQSAHHRDSTQGSRRKDIHARQLIRLYRILYTYQPTYLNLVLGHVVYKRQQANVDLELTDNDFVFIQFSQLAGDGWIFIAVVHGYKLIIYSREYRGIDTVLYCGRLVSLVT